MLQCQNYILADQVSTFQPAAKKASVEVAQAKLSAAMWHGKVDKKEVHLAKAKAGVDLVHSAIQMGISGMIVRTQKQMIMQTRQHNLALCKPRRNQNPYTQPAWHWKMETDAQGNTIRRDTLEDYTKSMTF